MFHFHNKEVSLFKYNLSICSIFSCYQINVTTQVQFSGQHAFHYCIIGKLNMASFAFSTFDICQWSFLQFILSRVSAKSFLISLFKFMFGRSVTHIHTGASNWKDGLKGDFSFFILIESIAWIPLEAERGGLQWKWIELPFNRHSINYSWLIII